LAKFSGLQINPNLAIGFVTKCKSSIIAKAGELFFDAGVVESGKWDKKEPLFFFKKRGSTFRNYKNRLFRPITY
jgi:hypothetical protein